MTYPEGQTAPGTQVVHPGDARKPSGAEPRDLADGSAHATSTHYPDKRVGDAARPGGRNGDGVSDIPRGYSTDQGSLPSVRDVTGGRIRKISDGT